MLETLGPWLLATLGGALALAVLLIRAAVSPSGRTLLGHVRATTCEHCTHWDAEEGQVQMSRARYFMMAASHIPPSQMGRVRQADPLPIAARRDNWEMFGACPVREVSREVGLRDGEDEPILDENGIQRMETRNETGSFCHADDTCPKFKRAPMLVQLGRKPPGKLAA